MPGVTGISYICDRCGKTHFVPSLGAGFPKEWMNVEGKYLCPTCSVPFRKFVTWFFDEDAIPEKWKEKE